MLKRSLYVNIIEEAKEYDRLLNNYIEAENALNKIHGVASSPQKGNATGSNGAAATQKDSATGSNGAGNTAEDNDTLSLLKRIAVNLERQGEEQRKQWQKQWLQEYVRSCRWLPAHEDVFFTRIPSPLFIPSYYKELWEVVRELLEEAEKQQQQQQQQQQPQPQQHQQQNYIQLNGSPGIGKSTALALFANWLLSSSPLLGACNSSEEQSLLAIFTDIAKLVDLVVVVAANAVHVAFKGISASTSTATAAHSGFVVFTSHSGNELADVACTLDSMAPTKKSLVLYDSGERPYRSSALSLSKRFVVSVLATSNDRTQYREFAKNEALRIVHGGPLAYEEAEALGLDDFDERWKAAGGVLRHLRQKPALVKSQIDENLRLLGPGGGSLSLECAPRLPYVFVDVPMDGCVVQQYASSEARERHVTKCDLLSEQRLAVRLQEALQQGLGDVAGRYFEMYGIERLKGPNSISLTLHRLSPKKAQTDFELLNLTFSGTSMIHPLVTFKPAEFDCLLVPPKTNYPVIDAMYVESQSAVVYLIQYTISTTHKPCRSLSDCVNKWTVALSKCGLTPVFRFIWVGMDATRGVTRTYDCLQSLQMQQYAAFLNSGHQCTVQRQADWTAYSVEMPHDAQDGRAINTDAVMAQMKKQLFPDGTYAYHQDTILISKGAASKAKHK